MFSMPTFYGVFSNEHVKRLFLNDYRTKVPATRRLQGMKIGGYHEFRKRPTIVVCVETERLAR